MNPLKEIVLKIQNVTFVLTIVCYKLNYFSILTNIL